jgi:hypothetical protein
VAFISIKTAVYAVLIASEHWAMYPVSGLA